MIFAMRDVGDCENALAEADFLGVTLDSGLRWGPHIDGVARKLTRGVYVLRSLSARVSLHVLKTVYYAFFHSHIFYAILACGQNGNKNNLEPLYWHQNGPGYWAITFFNALPQHMKELSYNIFRQKNQEDPYKRMFLFIF
ncbi:hypothetical protein HUJ05_012239 [Dendroctonus ponderosae]|nr:hypothetical protein HUJ05_012239 [Dendroctonus ponderosae]